MAKVVGDIAIQLGADISPLQKGMGKASGALKGFEGDAKKMGKTLAKVGVAVGTAAVAMAGGLLAAGKQASASAKEISNLSRVGNAGVVEFQKMAVAAAKYGISQEKISDILKDFNDRIGDFVETGGGPMADFFENIAPLVGVTADQFARLSGPEALQLYVSSLEQAGASQQQMTFYLEAMASDTTALIPLLANGGRELKKLGDEAQKAGRIISADMVQAGVDLDSKLTELSETIKTSYNVALLENAELIENIAFFISDKLIPAASSLGTAFSDIATSVGQGTAALKEFYDNAVGNGNGPLAQAPGQAKQDASEVLESNTGMFSLDADGNLIELGLPDTKLLPSNGSSTGIGTGKGRGKGGGKSTSGNDFEAGSDFEALQQQYASEQELLDIHLQTELEKLEEFRNKKLESEQTFNELESRIRAEHLEAQEALDEKARQAKLAAAQGIFGDLSTLMQTNSKKLFEIGKAAATANAIVTGYEAAVEAWEYGMSNGGPLAATAFTAASLAKTGSLISSIQSQSIGGSSGTASSGGSATTPTAPVDRKVAEFNFSGTTLYQGEQLVQSINEAQERGYIVKAVAI